MITSDVFKAKIRASQFYIDFEQLLLFINYQLFALIDDLYSEALSLNMNYLNFFVEQVSEGVCG